MYLQCNMPKLIDLLKKEDRKKLKKYKELLDNRKKSKK